MYSDQDLQAMSAGERADLARRLAALNLATEFTGLQSRSRRFRRWFMAIVITSCAALMFWTVLLALTLPPHYIAGHWNAAWVGFDIALLAGLVATAWTAWLRRQAVILAAFTTATLLTCDAWFDVLTASSNRDVAMSVASAVCIELPLAGLLFFVARRLLLLTVHAARTLIGLDPDIPLYRVPLFGIAPRSSKSRAKEHSS